MSIAAMQQIAGKQMRANRTTASQAARMEIILAQIAAGVQANRTPGGGIRRLREQRQIDAFNRNHGTGDAAAPNLGGQTRSAGVDPTRQGATIADPTQLATNAPPQVGPNQRKFGQSDLAEFLRRSV